MLIHAPCALLVLQEVPVLYALLDILLRPVTLVVLDIIRAEEEHAHLAQ